MQKSYAKLVSRRSLVTEAHAVAEATDKLRRHSCRSVICSQCENDEASRFQVTDVDNNGSVTEVTCKVCKEKSYVCQCECSCQKLPTRDNLERSYKEKLSNRDVKYSRKSICICRVMKSTVALLRYNNNNNGNTACSCGNDDPHNLEVVAVDQLGFIASVKCSACQTSHDLSLLEESYIVQIHGQSDQVLAGDHRARIDELCDLLRRHSFYEHSICPERASDEQECCRVTAINKESRNPAVTEVEFVFKNERQVRRLHITCHSCCYYRNTPPSKYELTYKEVMRRHLGDIAAETGRREQTNVVHSEEAVLSCTVLAASAAILRRHAIDNKLCQHCKNDDHNFIEVKRVDRCGFITHVQCLNCHQSTEMSTACHNSRCYYEEIDESTPLERGDHVAWHRNSGYWHHAIVTRTDDQRMTVAHYASSGCSVTFHESTKTRQDMSTSFVSGTAYRITYDDCYTNEYAALRAEKSLGEKQYNVLNRNCEHSSHRCKTGLSKSDQVITGFSSVGKTVLAFGLRILNMVLLIIFQAVHEKREDLRRPIDRKAFERFEHIITSSYMLLVFLLFFVWSMYSECNKLKPTTANKCCCNRPPGVAFGLSIRIIAREILAALGPFLLIWFEDSILPQEELLLEKIVTIIFTLLIVTIISYLLGIVFGTLLEYISKRCISYCGVTSTRRDHLEGEIGLSFQHEANELPPIAPVTRPTGT